MWLSIVLGPIDGSSLILADSGTYNNETDTGGWVLMWLDGL